MMDLIDGLDTRLSKSSSDKFVDEGYLSGRNSSVACRKISRKSTTRFSSGRRSRGRSTGYLSREVTFLSLEDVEGDSSPEGERRREGSGSPKSRDGGQQSKANTVEEDRQDWQEDWEDRKEEERNREVSLSDSDEYDTDLDSITLKTEGRLSQA